MPRTLTTPVAQPNATQWLLTDVKLSDVELVGGLKVRIELQLFAADGITPIPSVRPIVLTVPDDFTSLAQLNTDMTNASGNTLTKIRKACYLAAARVPGSPMGAGSDT